MSALPVIMPRPGNSAKKMGALPGSSLAPSLAPSSTHPHHYGSSHAPCLPDKNGIYPCCVVPCEYNGISYPSQNDLMVQLAKERPKQIQHFIYRALPAPKGQAPSGDQGKKTGVEIITRDIYIELSKNSPEVVELHDYMLSGSGRVSENDFSIISAVPSTSVVVSERFLVVFGDCQDSGTIEVESVATAVGFYTQMTGGWPADIAADPNYFYAPTHTTNPLTGDPSLSMVPISPCHTELTVQPVAKGQKPDDIYYVNGEKVAPDQFFNKMTSPPLPLRVGVSNSMGSPQNSSGKKPDCLQMDSSVFSLDGHQVPENQFHQEAVASDAPLHATGEDVFLVNGIKVTEAEFNWLSDCIGRGEEIFQVDGRFVSEAEFRAVEASVNAQAAGIPTDPEVYMIGDQVVTQGEFEEAIAAGAEEEPSHISGIVSKPTPRPLPKKFPSSLPKGLPGGSSTPVPPRSPAFGSSHGVIPTSPQFPKGSPNVLRKDATLTSLSGTTTPNLRADD